jgi:signal transduction histidine kinase
MENHIFTFLALGFNASCSLYFILRYFSKKAPYYIYFACIGILHSLYMIFRNPLFLEVFDKRWHPVLLQVSSVSLSSVVLFFFLFMLYFLDLRNQRYIKNILRFGVLYMSSGILCKILKLSYPWAAYASESFFIKYFIVIDALTMFSLLYYVIKIRKKHSKYLLIGIITIILLGLSIHGNVYFGWEVSRYYTRQTEIILGNILFFLMILAKEKEEQDEFVRTLAEKENTRLREIKEERDRIARDLHDEIGAGVSAIKLQLELLNRKKIDREEDIEELLSMSESISQSMRQMIRNLNGLPVDTGTFVNHISEYAEQFFAKTAIDLTTNRVLTHESRQLDPTLTHNLFLCVKEALNNIYKHSKATAVNLAVLQDDTTLTLTIKDNGIGLSGPNRSDSYGLNNMRTRMESVQGTFTLTSENGVTLTFVVKA